jgi:hypothetical protein
MTNKNLSFTKVNKPKNGGWKYPSLLANQNTPVLPSYHAVTAITLLLAKVKSLTVGYMYTPNLFN